jgi:hypothetical protein
MDIFEGNRDHVLKNDIFRGKFRAETRICSVGFSSNGFGTFRTKFFEILHDADDAVTFDF